MAQSFDQRIAPALAYIPSWITPNHLSILRGALVIPTLVRTHRPWEAVAWLILSSIFDILDGPLARTRGVTSERGALIDALSDKVFVLGLLIFAVRDRVLPVVFWSILALEILLIAVRPLKKWALMHDRLDATDANRSNKWGAIKTWIQTIAIAFLLTRDPWFLRASKPVFLLALAFAVASLLGHLAPIRLSPRTRS